MKPRITWIVVADAAKATVFSHKGPGKGLEPVKGASWAHEVKSSGEINADAPGRSFDSHGHGRHAMEPPTDPKEHAIQEFARRVAEHLKAALNYGSYERLILIAAPSFLGDLRKVLDKEVQKHVTAELPRDLVHMKIEDVARHLEEVLAV
ncbi:MAG: host attachment protein [Hyphomicrobiales bacterium]